jgi:protein TonB
MMLREQHWIALYRNRERISYLIPMFIGVATSLCLMRLYELKNSSSKTDSISYILTDQNFDNKPVQEKRNKSNAPSNSNAHTLEEKSKIEPDLKSKLGSLESTSKSSNDENSSTLQESIDKFSAATQSANVSAVGLRYEGLVLAALEKTKRYPTSREARESRPEGVVRVWLTLDRSGSLLDCGLINSSGSNLLDSEAIKTVKRGAYPAFPNSVFPGESSHRFTTSLKFSINS